MKQIMLAGLFLMLLAACSCRAKESPIPPAPPLESSSLPPELLKSSPDDIALAKDATATWLAWNFATDAEIKALNREIPSTHWADRIKALNPIRVYVHRVNIVVVQRVSNGTEEGVYIRTHVSSYLPQSGIDDFVLSPNPERGGRYYLGNGIFDFKRKKNK